MLPHRVMVVQPNTCTEGRYTFVGGERTGAGTASLSISLAEMLKEIAHDHGLDRYDLF